MFFPVLCGPFCEYDEILDVSGAGLFFFDYDSGFLYVTDEGAVFASILKVYDMANKAAPVLVATVGPVAAHTHWVHPVVYNHPSAGKILLLCCRDDAAHKLQIYDVNDPTNPTFMGEVDTVGTPSGVAAIGTTACVGINNPFFSGGKTAREVDISDPTAPVMTGSTISITGIQRGFSVRATDTRYFVSGEYSSGGTGYLMAIDASDFSLDDLTQSANIGAGVNYGTGMVLNAAGTVAMTGGGNGDLSLTVWDISTPTNITIIDTNNEMWGQIFCLCWREETNRLYSGSAVSTVKIADTSDLSNITIVGAIATGGTSVTDIAIIDDGCAGLAWGQGNGAAIHLLGEPPLS